MPRQWTDVMSFVTGAVRRKDIAYLALVADELTPQNVDHTYPLAWNDPKWFGGDIGMQEWTTAGVAVVRRPLEQGIFLGRSGEILCMGSGDVHREKIRPGEPDSPGQRGLMTGIRGIGKTVFAVGMSRQAYRRDGVDIWTCIDQSARPEAGDRTVYSFESIDGFSEEDLYGVGRRGEIWHYDGTTWRPIDSLTNQILTNVCCAGDGVVYICGRQGMLIQGRANRWEVIDHKVTHDDFWGISWLGDRLYVSSMRGVFSLRDKTLASVDFGEDVPQTYYHLSSRDGVMYSIGAKDVMMFDENKWTRID
jgi:hypothetical protein